MSGRCQESERRPDGRVLVAVLIALALGASAAACSRRALTDDARGTAHFGDGGGFDGAAGQGGADDAIATDVRTDANAELRVADGGGAEGTPCAGMTCGATDLCVETFGCGGPLNCHDLPDSGQCPVGSTYNTNCMTAGRWGGCVPDCPPPFYACAPRPAACPAVLDCSCIDRSVCPFGTCLSAQDRFVTCGFE